MSVSIPQGTNYSPSAMSTFDDCQARFWHERNDDGSGRLPTDLIPAGVGSAIHDALMAFHRDMEGRYLNNNLPSAEDAEAILAGHIDRALFKNQLDPAQPTVAARLAQARTGVGIVAAMAITDMPQWVRDDRHGVLVWTEARLDHGPGIRAVELAPGVLSPTKPDVIGIRQHDSGTSRVVVKDYKARGSAVNPEFDNGILLRAIWALAELENPRCRWFVAGRQIEIERDVIDVETVNVMHAGTPEFFIHRSMTANALWTHRNRMISLSGDMSAVDASGDAALVPATPGYLCESSCPFLHRCTPGQAHVSKYAGVEALEERVAQLG